MKTLRGTFAAAIAALALTACQVGPQRQPEPPTAPEEVPMYTDAAFREVVAKYVRDDGQKVDYAAWQANTQDRAALEGYVDLLAKVSPESHPEQFPTPAAERGYWINAYNALVLQGVLEHWPLESVRDVKISLTSRLIPGKGFFYDRKVVVGGRETNLYNLEKQMLRTQKDPRMHFALNCASESCPALRPWEWTDEQLDMAAREFVNEPENVAVEDGALYLSRIFKWYRKDFPDDIHGYLAQYAEPDLAASLAAAAEAGYPVRYREYDWSLNADAAS